MVLPIAPLLGTYTQAAVLKAKQLVRVGKLAQGASAIGTSPDGEGWNCRQRRFWITFHPRSGARRGPLMARYMCRATKACNRVCWSL